MRDEVRAAVATLKALARGLDPVTLLGPDALGLMEDAAEGERVCAAIKVLAAKRVDETGVWRRSGEPSAAHLLATKTGVGIGQAERALDTVAKLDVLPVTSEAFRAGRLSEVQAHEIAGAASKDPTAESELVHAARRRHLKGLKEDCRRVRAAAEADDTAWAERLQQNRRLRMWTEADGAPAGIWRLAPEAGASVKAALDAETDLLFREARKEGRREARDAYAADALHALITRGPRKASSAHLVADQTAIDRGYVERGERCDITGIGPVPVTVAKTMLADAKVREVPRAPDELPEFTSASRYYPAWMTDWLDTRYPTCGVKGCDAEYRLQTDHVIALEDGGRTQLDNLWRLCPYHHSLKTNRGWRVTGTTHDWDLEPPDDPDPP